MKLIMRTSNKSIVEKQERGDRYLDSDAQRGAVLDILLAAIAANGMRLCEDSDIKWELFEARVLAYLRRCRKCHK